MSTDETGVVTIIVPETKVGALSIVLGGPDSEMVQVKSSVGFLWRGRNYPGVIMLKRKDFSEFYGYSYALKTERGDAASWRVYHNLSQVVSDIVQAYVQEHPETLEAAHRVSLEARLVRAQNAVRHQQEALDTAEQELEALFAEVEAIKS